MITKYKAFMNIGLGEFIREEMEIRDWNQEVLSSVMGVSVKTVNNLINNRQVITEDIARLLSRAFGQSPGY